MELTNLPYYENSLFTAFLRFNFIWAKANYFRRNSANFDKKVKICDKIHGSHIIQSNGMTLLNVGKPYPDNPLTLAIFEKDLKNFSYVPADFLPEKSFCVTGKLILYKDKPEITLKSEKDIEIIEEKIQVGS